MRTLVNTGVVPSLHIGIAAIGTAMIIVHDGVIFNRPGGYQEGLRLQTQHSCNLFAGICTCSTRVHLDLFLSEMWFIDCSYRS